ncbi:protein ABHD13-like [Panonychus citri]|uniref:protein ABHD13-like n=1 Tax=Panonychus citri TaxID=50023 RepID=UPI0023074D7B|nr:protein ABHD13-like [Panonychus citri]
MNLFRSVFDKFNYRPNYETSSSFRMTLRLKKFFSPSVRQVLTIIGIILMKCWRNILLLLTIFCIILVLLGFWYIIFFTPLAVVYFLWKLSDDLIYHPDSPPDSRKNVASPSTVQLPFTDLYLTTEDNVKIHCMFIQQRDTDSRSSGESPATFLYLHGNAGNIGHRLNNVAELFHFLKVNILLVEYRGYGYSQGRPSEKGLHKDAPRKWLSLIFASQNLF